MNLHTSSQSNNIEPMRHPCKGYTCHGGFDADTGTRPFKHATGLRAARKSQRRAGRLAILADVVPFASIDAA